MSFSSLYCKAPNLKQRKNFEGKKKSNSVLLRTEQKTFFFFLMLQLGYRFLQLLIVLT